MNTRNTVRWLLPLALCAQWAVAQEAPPPPPPGAPVPPPPPGAMRRGNGEGPGRRGLGEGVVRERLREHLPPGGPGQGPRMLERPEGAAGGHFEGVRIYLAKLKEENPEKYEKLMKLQQDNPAEFRQILRSHMTKELLKRKLDGFPEIREAIEKMPEERRAELTRRFMGMPDAGPGPGPNAGPDARPGDERGDQRGPPARFEKMRDLTRKMQKAGTDDERAAAKAELLKAAGEAFDANIQERMEHLERMEQEIKRIRAELDEQKGRKEQMIKERIERALQQKADSPGPGREGPGPKPEGP